MGLHLIREMAVADLDQVLAIERVSFPTPWSREMFERDVTINHFARCLVLTDDQRVVAYLDYWNIHGEAHLMTVAAHPDCRRQGLAERLIRHALEELRLRRTERVTLEVRVSNAAARALYAKLGFRELAVRKKYYYDTDEDALVLARTFAPSPLPLSRNGRGGNTLLPDGEKGRDEGEK